MEMLNSIIMINHVCYLRKSTKSGLLEQTTEEKKCKKQRKFYMKSTKDKNTKEKIKEELIKKIRKNKSKSVNME